jgi:hypothetical protein
MSIHVDHPALLTHKVEHRPAGEVALWPHIIDTVKIDDCRMTFLAGGGISKKRAMDFPLVML